MAVVVVVVGPTRGGVDTSSATSKPSGLVEDTFSERASTNQACGQLRCRSISKATESPNDDK